MLPKEGVVLLDRGVAGVEALADLLARGAVPCLAAPTNFRRP
jgi:hypothetical protein